MPVPMLIVKPNTFFNSELWDTTTLRICLNWIIRVSDFLPTAKKIPKETKLLKKHSNCSKGNKGLSVMSRGTIFLTAVVTSSYVTDLSGTLYSRLLRG